MAFPASTQIKLDALRTARGEALSIKNDMQNRVSHMAATSVRADYILAILDRLVRSIATLEAAAAVPGIAAYAQDQHADQGLDIAAEFTAMVGAAETARDWIVTNMPNDGTYILAASLAADGTLTYRTFTPAQTAGLRTNLAALIATIG